MTVRAVDREDGSLRIHIEGKLFLEDVEAIRELFAQVPDGTNATIDIRNAPIPEAHVLFALAAILDESPVVVSLHGLTSTSERLLSRLGVDFSRSRPTAD